jgi:hypothetical protein
MHRFFSARKEIFAVLLAASVLSISSFLYFFDRGMTNVYGDGVAHTNIARKVVDHPDDSLWQRYIQIGTPWLPLQTMLMLPLVSIDSMWRSGAAGSIVSMLFFVLASCALYKLASLFYRDEDPRWKKRLPALTLAIFALNPSALYMQTTPMSELVFMGALAIAVYLLQRWAFDQTRKNLLLAALAMTLATLSRYEAWPVAAASALIVAALSSGRLIEKFKHSSVYCAIALTGPGYWLWHNRAIYGNAFEFLTGPHSARGIFLQNEANLGWSRIFVGNAALDLLLMTATVAVIIGPLVLLLSAAGFLKVTVSRRRGLIRCLPSMLLIIPFFFHTMSLYRGEIQIFPLSAFGLLNVRYGLPHLLAFALFAPATLTFFTRRGRNFALMVFISIAGLQYGLLISDGPSQIAVYQEGYRNGVNSRPARERSRAASLLRDAPPDPIILMTTGSLGPVVSKSGMRFSDIIHEGTIRWHAIESEIPADVSTVIVEEGDLLDRRIVESARLVEDFRSRFRQIHQIGPIRIYVIKKTEPL